MFFKPTTFLLVALSFLLIPACCGEPGKTRQASEFGFDAKAEDNAPACVKLSNAVKNQDVNAVVKFKKGIYSVHPKDALSPTLYISNHDQDNPKKVCFLLENAKNLTLDFGGSTLLSYGSMITLAIRNCENITIRNLTIDCAEPQIADVEYLSCDEKTNRVTARVRPGTQYRIVNNRLQLYGEGFTENGQQAIAFNGKTRHMLPNYSDVGFPKLVEDLGNGKFVLESAEAVRMGAGTHLAYRSWHRPSPGIVLSESKNTVFEKVTVRYSEGMGLLAQMSENITLDGFVVAPDWTVKNPRYFATQADATHFSGCKGRIISQNGLYENMMDDAINVHGTYLRAERRVDDYTLEARYMHGQAWGFVWGYPGDSVQFIAPKTMELYDGVNTLVSITPLDKPTVDGAKKFRLVFKNKLPENVGNNRDGIENLTWTPEVTFRNNIVRNNRARGALFSTPRTVICEDNTFDHVSGCAILLCGDCNGWFETGACKDVQIRKNRFINCLTCSFQFTNAIISVYPEIPNLGAQQKYFHSGIVIEDNLFDTFNVPLLYAKSVDGLVFKGNKVKYNNDYQTKWQRKKPFWFDRCKNITLDITGETALIEKVKQGLLLNNVLDLTIIPKSAEPKP